jgi:hypothetical protein
MTVCNKVVGLSVHVRNALARFDALLYADYVSPVKRHFAKIFGALLKFSLAMRGGVRLERDNHKRKLRNENFST